MRVSTSASQACGSTSFSLQVSISEAIAAQLATTVRTGEQRILAAQSHHPFILPMSGKKRKFIIAGILISAARCWCAASSSEPPASFFWCKGQPAL